MDVSGIHFQQLIFLNEKPINPLKLYFPLAHQSWTSRHMYVGWKDSMVAFFRDVASPGSIELISVDSGCIPPLKWTCGETNWFSCSKPPEVIDLMLSDLVFPQWNEDDRLVNKLKKQVFALVVLEGYGSAVRQPVKWSLMPHSVGFKGGWPFAKVTDGKLGELWWLSYDQFHVFLLYW